MNLSRRLQTECGAAKSGTGTAVPVKIGRTAGGALCMDIWKLGVSLPRSRTCAKWQRKAGATSKNGHLATGAISRLRE